MECVDVFIQNTKKSILTLRQSRPPDILPEHQQIKIATSVDGHASYLGSQIYSLHN